MGGLFGQRDYVASHREDAVAASSLCEARQKLPETVFKTLNDELISLWHAHRDTPAWKGHRVFAIDGSKINAPRGLLEYGYKTPQETTRHINAQSALEKPTTGALHVAIGWSQIM
ncbi:hypothetical protein [Paraburkholderia aspalathi]|uniref:hypothetical protein n=1 Tax=Paraburkholderia aspalathi TaxID=1324617 RepID=UPI00190D093B|nr:hypothetical protein [Paraburkholderia aspalathi]MBK3824343.1 hypothetical protein [Paraburkholderia aspalathi]MBK3836203.1 hypothetical protein [Paraburkholderia aspalathi]